MTRGDHAVESAADKLETIVKEAQSSGGVKAKPGGALAEDLELLRKLKPSWLVIGAALAVGYVAAKVIDWRGHAHPRS